MMYYMLNMCYLTIPPNSLWHRSSYHIFINKAGFKQIWWQRWDSDFSVYNHFMEKSNILIGHNQDTAFFSFHACIWKRFFCVCPLLDQEIAQLLSHFQLKDTFDFQVFPVESFLKQSSKHPSNSEFFPCHT